MRTLLAPFVLVLAVFTAGCAGTDLIAEAETTEQRYFAVLSVFDEYDQAALNIAQDPDTPESVVKGLKRARGVAKAALDLATTAFETYTATQAALEGNPDPDSLDKALAASQAFSERVQVAIDQINALRDAVDAI